METLVWKRRVITIDGLHGVDTLVKAGGFRLFETVTRIGVHVAFLNEVTSELMMAQIRTITGELDFGRVEREAEELQLMLDRYREALADVKREYKAACKEPRPPFPGAPQTKHGERK